MKKLIMGAAVAALLAAPVLAQSYNPTYGTGNTIPQPEYTQANPAGGAGTEAYAQAPASALHGPRSHATSTGDNVYGVDGQYIGADPDPFIRLELRRDPPGRD